MNNLLRKGFQPVSEKEMLMVEGGVLYEPPVDEIMGAECYKMTGRSRHFSGIRAEKYINGISGAASVASALNTARKFDSIGTSCLFCAVKSINDWF